MALHCVGLAGLLDTRLLWLERPVRRVQRKAEAAWSQVRPSTNSKYTDTGLGVPQLPAQGLRRSQGPNQRGIHQGRKAEA
jgi:hypothetical protein